MNKKININICDTGLYNGLNIPVALATKIVIGILVVLTVIVPGSVATVLGYVKDFMLNAFNYYYIYALSVFLIFCLCMIVLPIGKTKLGDPDSEPEFSNFSWFSMMFAAGIGIGMMFYSIGEPMYHFIDNPHIISGLVSPATPEAVESTMRYTFLHWGLHPWSAYASVGLAMAYFSYRHHQPLTVRSTLLPLFGNKLSGPLGHIVDVIAVVAAVLGIAASVGTGVIQLISGFSSLGDFSWALDTYGKPTFLAITLVLFVVMGLSTISALTGVGRGIKWISNLNTVLSLFLMLIFCIFGSLVFALVLYAEAFIDYMLHLPSLSFTVWDVSNKVGRWQTDWTILYWTWWIAFTPLVGIFLARVSKGRTVREFVIGAMVVPTLVSFVWFTLMGGTAIDLELSGVSQGAIIGSPIENKMFVTFGQMMEPGLALVVSVVAVVLIFTFLITSVDSGVVVINTILSGGNAHPKSKHRLLWGIILTVVVGSLMFAGGLEAIKNAMIIGALPFSAIMLLMCAAMVKMAFFNED